MYNSNRLLFKVSYKHGFESTFLHLQFVLEGGGSVVVDALFIVVPIVCEYTVL